MATLEAVELTNYRSIEGPLRVTLPGDNPLILLGENNVGKSNIAQSLELLLGGYWPGNHDPEEHEFYGRSPDRRIGISLEFDVDDLLGGRYVQINWTHDPTLPVDERTSFWGQRPNGREGGVSNDDRDTCYCVASYAEDDLSYQLSYRSKATLLSKIMRRFHKDLQDEDEVRDNLEELFRETKEEFYRIPSFSSFSESLREQLGDFLGSMTHELQVDFEAYNPVNFFQALRLQPVDNGQPRAIEELGTGEQQVLAISLAYAYAESFHTGLLLVLEEPESHLHPLAQQWLARRLRSLADGGVQLVITTHSPHFIDIMNLEGLCLVRKERSSTRTIQRSVGNLVDHCVASGVPRDRIDQNSALPFYRSHSTTDILEGFFATVVVLVEGPTESLALPRYLERCDLDVTREGVAILAVHGKDNIAKWHRMFTLFEIPTYVIFDNDPSDDAQGNKRANILSALDVPEAQHDDYIDEDDWLIEERFAIFGADFERTFRRYFDEYEHLEHRAGDRYGITSKPFKARWVAEHLELSEEEDGTERLYSLSAEINELVEEASPTPIEGKGGDNQ